MPALLRVGSARTLEGGFPVTAHTSEGGPTALLGVGIQIDPPPSSQSHDRWLDGLIG